MSQPRGSFLQVAPVQGRQKQRQLGVHVSAWVALLLQTWTLSFQAASTTVATPATHALQHSTVPIASFLLNTHSQL